MDFAFLHSRMVADVPWGQDKGPEAGFWLRCWASSHLCWHILVTMFIMLYVQSYFSILVCWYAVDTGIHKFDLVLCEFIVILVDSRVPALMLLLIVSAGYRGNERSALEEILIRFCISRIGPARSASPRGCITLPPRFDRLSCNERFAL